jgi:hypothetical protein
VSRDCTELEIKKAYRKESLKHHPDKVRYYLAVFWVITLPLHVCRVATKKNLSSSLKRTPYSLIHGDENATTWVKTKMEWIRAWEVWEECRLWIYQRYLRSSMLRVVLDLGAVGEDIRMGTPIKMTSSTICRHLFLN